MSGWSGGTFTRGYNWVNDRDANIDITASRMDDEFDIYATAMNNCLTKDGQNSATGNLPMATYRHTGVGNAAALTDYASADQVVDGVLTAQSSASGNDTYAISLPINPGAYATYQRFQFIPDTANTGACTLNVNSIGAKAIKMPDGNDPPDNYILANSVVEVMYDGTNMVLMNAPAVVVNTTSTQTLTNKTLTSPSIGTNFTFDGVTVATIETAAEGITASDTAIPTSNAVKTEIATTVGGLSFAARQSANRLISNPDVIEFDDEIWDSDSRYNNTGSAVGGIPAWCFLPNVAGVYLVTLDIVVRVVSGPAVMAISILKNGVDAVAQYEEFTGAHTAEYQIQLSALANMNGTSDYIYVNRSFEISTPGTISHDTRGGLGGPAMFSAVRVGDAP